MKDWLNEHIIAWFYAAFGGIVLWVAKRATAKVDEQEARIAALERDKVTKDDIAELRESIDATFTRSQARIESRLDDVMMYLIRDDER